MIEATIKTDFNGFKKLAGEFFRQLPGANEEEAEAGLKCLSLAYLGMETSDDNEQYQASLVIEMATRKMVERLVAIG